MWLVSGVIRWLVWEDLETISPQSPLTQHNCILVDATLGDGLRHSPSANPESSAPAAVELADAL